MGRVTVLGLLCVALAGPYGLGRDQRLTFAGEVSEGQTYRKSVDHGLDFVLAPSTSGPGVITGWIIRIVPQGTQPHAECIDFAWVVTPPYRSYNPLYLDTSYGVTAEEAVRRSPREFSFVLNCADFKTEAGRVDTVMWPYAHTQQEADKAMAKLGSSPLGKGRLWIEEYRITPTQKSAEGTKSGAIGWIKFKVEIEFPRGSAQRATP